MRYDSVVIAVVVLVEIGPPGKARFSMRNSRGSNPDIPGGKPGPAENPDTHVALEPSVRRESSGGLCT
jgi:hypothetical protein